MHDLYSVQHTPALTTLPGEDVPVCVVRDHALQPQDLCEADPLHGVEGREQLGRLYRLLFILLVHTRWGPT